MDSKKIKIIHSILLNKKEKRQISSFTYKKEKRKKEKKVVSIRSFYNYKVIIK